MKSYDITDSAWVQAPAERLFEEMSDFGHFPEWWPEHYKTRVVAAPVQLQGREIWIQPARGLTIGWKLLEAETGRSFRLEYSRGWHSGWGEWKFEPEQEGTRVSYRIAIVPKNMFYDFMYRVVNLRKRHSADIQGLIGLLASRVGAPAPKDLRTQSL